MKQYTPRRANKTRWLQSAPDYILDVFKHKEGYEFLFTGEKMLTSREVPRTYANTQIQGWYERESWFSLSAHECAQYRYRMGKKRVRWLDVPERLRITVIQKIELED